MKFNYKGRGFVIVTLSAMLVAVGIVNYQLSKKSLLETSKEFKAYEQAQLEKNSDEKDNKVGKNEEVQVVDSNASKAEERVTETSKAIEKELTSQENMKKTSYVIDMKMTREKQRNELVQELNEMINNPSTSEESRKEASNLKLGIVKNQDMELQIENILSTKGFENSLVYISDKGINVVVNKEKIEKKDAAKIFDLVAQQSGAKYENIKLTNNK